MRVASVVARSGATSIVALLALFASGCSISTGSVFCSKLTHTKLDFGKVADASHELRALDQVIASLPARDRHLLTPVRDYARILYRRSNWSEDRKLKFLRHFFRVDAPALDRRLRDDCNLPLDKRISPFNVAAGGRS